jgi:hypothetical protein
VRCALTTIDDTEGWGATRSPLPIPINNGLQAAKGAMEAAAALHVADALVAEPMR